MMSIAERRGHSQCDFNSCRNGGQQLDAGTLTKPGGDFETYYRSAPARDFAFRVWTNNFFISWEALFSGILLGIPVLPMLFVNSANIALDGSYMVSAGRGDVFFAHLTTNARLNTFGA